MRPRQFWTGDMMINNDHIHARVRHRIQWAMRGNTAIDRDQ